jgi:ABC-type polysaccharide/polyol phosphate export permease
VSPGVRPGQRPAREWRDLIVLLTLREFKRRYLTISAGIAFMLLVSLASLAVLSAVFGSVFRQSVRAPYPLFVFCGLIPWNFLQSTTSHSVDAFRANANVVRKVSFPRALVPISVVTVNAAVMASSLAALVPFLLLQGYAPGWRWLWAPVALASVLALGAGLAMLLSTLAVYYVEIRPLTDVMLMLWFYASPVFYPASIVPARFAWISLANPMTHIVAVMRAALLDEGSPSPTSVAVSLLAGMAALAVGSVVMARAAPTIADHVS